MADAARPAPAEAEARLVDCGEGGYESMVYPAMVEKAKETILAMMRAQAIRKLAHRRHRSEGIAAIATFASSSCDPASPAAMASLYAPRLTRWRVATSGGGVVRDCVEYDGKPLFFRREDCRRLVPDDEEDARQCLEIAGEVFPLMEERMVPAALHGGGGVREAARCVEYVDDDGAVLLLTVTPMTEGKEKEVVVVDGGEVRVVDGGGYYDPDSGTVEHVVDVEGAREAYVLLVSVREALNRIVRIKRLN
uniref:Uncharacterized protein n=1 Tax=Oryza glumipatula TaxID=40148 RepID=A0A0E0AYC0_9ORYZ